MGCTESVNFECKTWKNPFTEENIMNSAPNRQGELDGCRDNIDELQESFNVAMKIIRNKNNDKDDRELVRDNMLKFKEKADYYVNTIISQGAGNGNILMCSLLNDLNNEVRYKLTDLIELYDLEYTSLD
jgi:hypothetical protein